MGSISITNLQEVLKGFDLTEQKIDLAAYQAIFQASLKVEEVARRNANTGVHAAGEGHIPGTGPGPNVVSGNLVGKIVAQKPTIGFRGYQADINSSAIYARAVEQGSPRWKSGVKYPYLEPAGQTLLSNGTLRTIFVGAFVMAVRGSA